MADQYGQGGVCGSKSVGQYFACGVGIFSRIAWREGRHSLRIAIAMSSYATLGKAGYKSSLLGTSKSDHGWEVFVRFSMGWTLILIYAAMIPLYLWAIWHLWSVETGLKWDVVSIVDVLALFHGSNVLQDFEALELRPLKSAFRILSKKSYRMGYWEKGSRKEIWYGIGRTNRGSSK